MDGVFNAGLKDKMFCLFFKKKGFLAIKTIFEV